MANTSLHVSAELLARLDRRAAKEGTSRNRFIVKALEEAVARPARGWSPELFEAPGPGDMAELGKGAAELDAAIAKGRRSKRRPPL